MKQTAPEAAITEPDPRRRAIAEEQPYIDRLYAQLEALRERTATRLAQIYQQEGWDEQSIWERDVFAARDLQRLQRLNGVDRGLCFGRLDFRADQDDEPRYIGRIGLSDDEYHQLLVDWRAPAAEPFYRATAADPGDVGRRRHIQTKRREVIGVDDEVFDANAVKGDDAAALSGEAALMASLGQARTGRMSDIVATIQAEQDRVIRADARGVLVVQGAPGTGKTVAALHRAAYLLYTHRDRLANSGVLVLGPNRRFLHYIDEVLPSLGETGVVLSTVSDLYPGISATASEADQVAAAKGDEEMIDLISSAVKRLQKLPRRAVPIVVDDSPLMLEPSVVRRARAQARRSRRPHNAARPVFAREILTDLAQQYTRRLGELDGDDLADVRFELSGDEDVQAVLDQLWPVMTPETLIRRLFASDPAAPWFRRDGEWTPADVPLLDEAAELLGDAPDDAALAAERRQEAERRAEAEFARDLLGELDLPIPVDPDEVAERYRGMATGRPVNERAAGDRNWAFGHLIVDEAQELSPMAWRMVMRRIPSKSLTVVGDIAQTGATAGARSWASVFDRLAPGRWREETLTINYRTPSEVMAMGASVLDAIDPSLEAPRSVRSTGEHPWLLHATDPRLAEELVDAVSTELKILDGGMLAVIVPPSRAEAVRDALTAALPPDTVGADDPSELGMPVAVLTVNQAKGLEFDSVIVVEPSSIVSESSRGLTDLYVAVTRPTRRLGIVHTGDLPDPLRPPR